MSIKVVNLSFIVFLLILNSCINKEKKETFPIEYNLIKNNKYEGLHFWKNDTSLIVSMFKNGIQSGGYTRISINTGNVEHLTQFKNGEENGFIYDFYPSGVVKEFGEVKNNKKTNIGIEYHDISMRLKVYKEYNQDGFVIYRVEKDSSGKKIKEEDYR